MPRTKSNKPKEPKDRGAFSINWYDEIEWFRDQAVHLGMTQANLVRFAVKEYVDKRNKENSRVNKA